VVPKNGLSADDVLRYAAMAEEHSNHPIAASIRDAWKRSGRDGGAHPSEYAEVGGRGIRAVVEGRHILAGNDALLHESSIEHDTCVVEGTSVQVAVDGRWAGYIVIGDEIRPEARPALETLRSLGVSRTVLLSGDDADVVRAVASRVGISEAHGNLLPEEKVARLEQIVREPGRRGAVAFVGDGINDAPVLARADVGIAMGPAGADAAVETADVVLMSENPGKVAEAISHARRTRAIVLQNIVLALGIKGVFLALGGVGVATMWEAVIADMGVALAAILNAARALR
jgi:Cd2+/Zn2+-exporting ATPase